MPCPFCLPAHERRLWQGERCRVILADEPPFPGFCRVVWRDHVREMTDLAASDRAHLMDVVFGVEASLRELLAPAKVNLASLGNQTEHLHWHVIPRYRDDSHFPDPIWSQARRPAPPRELDEDALRALIAARLAEAG